MYPYLTSYIRAYSKPSDLDDATVVWVGALSGFMHGALMFVGGLISRKIGIRLTVLIGCVILTYVKKIMPYVTNQGYDLMPYVTNQGCDLMPHVTIRTVTSNDICNQPGLWLMTCVTNQGCDLMAYVTTQGCYLMTYVTKQGCDLMTYVTKQGCDLMTNVTNQGCDLMPYVTNQDRDLMPHVTIRTVTSKWHM